MDTVAMLDTVLDKPAASEKAAEALRRFAAGVAAEQAESRSRGVPYAIKDEGGRMVWVHPDGTSRIGPEAASDLAR